MDSGHVASHRSSQAQEAQSVADGEAADHHQDTVKKIYEQRPVEKHGDGQHYLRHHEPDRWKEQAPAFVTLTRRGVARRILVVHALIIADWSTSFQTTWLSLSNWQRPPRGRTGGRDSLIWAYPPVQRVRRSVKTSALADVRCPGAGRRLTGNMLHL
jgi:hypothetical protein